MTAFGKRQVYAGVQCNVGIAHRDKIGVDLLLYSLATSPLTRRSDASTALFSFAPIASRPVKIRGITITPYGGLLTIVPAGNREDKIFTPPETGRAAVIGVAVPLNKDWIAFFEWNPAPNLRSAGTAVSRLYPK
jgi:hypothetical protein